MKPFASALVVVRAGLASRSATTSPKELPTRSERGTEVDDVNHPPCCIDDGRLVRLLRISGQIATSQLMRFAQTTTFRELLPLAQQVRCKLASITALWSAWHLARALRNELRWRPVTRSKYAKCFTARTDPWGYEVTPFTLEKFQAAIELLDGARRDACFERGWEIGCAEGAMTAPLAQICKRLSAVDFIPLALERAHLRCQEFSNISFSEWDLTSDPAPGTFDLIVITDVLGSLGGQRDIYRARDKMVSALAPGGYLLYGDYLGDLHNRRIHESWWGRLLLLRPRNILRLVAAHPALVEVARRETTMHLLVLFRNRR
jgi:SAM-dependent methyltransferase